MLNNYPINLSCAYGQKKATMHAVDYKAACMQGTIGDECWKSMI